MGQALRHVAIQQQLGTSPSKNTLATLTIGVALITPAVPPSVTKQKHTHTYT